MDSAIIRDAHSTILHNMDYGLYGHNRLKVERVRRVRMQIGHGFRGQFGKVQEVHLHFLYIFEKERCEFVSRDLPNFRTHPNGVAAVLPHSYA